MSLVFVMGRNSREQEVVGEWGVGLPSPGFLDLQSRLSEVRTV